MALNTKNLIFFDKEGNRITTRLVEDTSGQKYHKFHLHFNSVSKKLFETEQLFIFEEVLKQYNPNETKHLIEPSSRFQTKLVQFCTRIFEVGEPLKESTLKELFIQNDSLFVDEVDKFATDNPSYIVKNILEDGQIEYSLTNKGIELVEKYNSELEYNALLNEGLKLEYVSPRQEYLPEAGEESYLYFKWTNEEFDKNIFLYQIDYNNLVDYTSNKNSLSLTIERDKFFPTLIPFYDFDLTADNSLNPDWKNTYKNYKLVPDRGTQKLTNKTFGEYSVLNREEELNTNPIQLNFALNGDDELIARRLLEVFVVTKTINKNSTSDSDKFIFNLTKLAEILFEGEVIGEDQRYKTLLTNFNRLLNESETYVYKETDVDEDYTDFKILNEKRKELIISGNEIYDYLGSYKAFVNAIKHFGYSDIKLREYFYDVTLSKPEKKKVYYNAIDIPLDLKNTQGFTEPDINNPYSEFLFGKLQKSFTNKFKKTARFGLTYNINEFSGNYDSNGFPIVQDTSTFTFEEVIIKLYGLKKVLEDNFLSHNARIIDITGEGIYFGKFKVDTYTESTSILSTEKKINPKFDCNPKKGTLKSIDKLLAFYKQKEGITSSITWDTNISNIQDLRPYDFMDDFIADFEFDETITYEKIKSYYPTYKELRSSIVEQLYKNRKYKPKNSKMFGFITELFLLDFDPLLEELDIPFDYLYNKPPSGDLIYKDSKKNDIQKYRRSIIENPDFDPTDFNETDPEYLKEPYVGTFAKTPMFQMDKLILLQGYDVIWKVEHESKKWYYEVSGRVLDKSKVLLFLPLMGKYNVTCIVRDNTGFPRMTQKKLEIEVLDELSQITAIGSFVETNTLGALEDVELSDIDDITFDVNGYCPIVTTIDDMKYIDFENFNYSNYKNQNFIQRYIRESEIIGIDDKNNRITLKGTEFLTNFIRFFKHRTNNTILIHNDESNVLLKEGLRINEVKINTIKLEGLQDLKIGEKLHVHKYLKTSNFRIGNDSTITLDNLEHTYFDLFQIGDTINLKQNYKSLGSNVKYDYYDQTYLIIDIEKDYINNIIKLTIEDDGSLLYVPTFEEVQKNSEFKFIKYRWNELEIKSDDYLFRIKDVIKNNDNTTTCVVHNPYYEIQELESKNLADYRVDYGVYSGEYFYKLSPKDFYLDENKENVIIQIDDEIENITTTFKVLYSDFDIKQALQLGKTNNLRLENLEEFTIDQLQNQTLDTLNFNQTPNLGFKILNFVDKGKIWFNDYEFVIDLGLPDVNNLIPGVDLNAYYQNWKWIRLTELLNSNKNEVVSKFRYYNVDNKYIQAISKFNDPEALISLRYSDSVFGQSDSYPKSSFIDNKWIFFDGPNNPQQSNYLAVDYGELGEFKNETNDPENLVPYIPTLTSTWTINNSFVKYKSFQAPVGTPIFFVYNDKKRNIEEWEWEIWKEDTDKLIYRSDKNFICWIFKDPGKYSIILKFKDESDSIRLIKKLSFFEITKEK